MINVTYWKNGKTFHQSFNVDFEDNMLLMDFGIIRKNLRKMELISAAIISNDIKVYQDYSLLDIEIIEELLLFLTSLNYKFSLVVKQSDDEKKKIIIHYSQGKYSHTEVTNGDKTHSSYLGIKESIQFAEQLFSNVIE